MIRKRKLAQWRLGRNVGAAVNIYKGSRGVDRMDEDEARRLRRLQMMMSMVMSVIGQDPGLTLEEAADMAANARRAALTMFPGKELTYDLIYRPRLQRLINERFRLQKAGGDSAAAWSWRFPKKSRAFLVIV